ncbi:hypothetical protein WDW89_18275 [Deltaproteobacteria bacterium TL4]
MKAEKKFFMGIGISLFVGVCLLVGYMLINFDQIKDQQRYRMIQQLNSRK